MTNGSAFKERAHLLVDSLPDDADRKELAAELAVLQDIEAGLYDSERQSAADHRWGPATVEGRLRRAVRGP